MSITSRTDGTSWSQQWESAAEVNVAGAPEPDDDRTPVALALLILLGFVLVGTAAVVLSSDDQAAEVAAPEVAAAVETTTPNVETTAPLSSAPSTTVAPETTAPETTTAPTTEAPVTTTTAAPETTAPVAATEAVSAESTALALLQTDVRTAVFSGGKVYLRGEVPSQEIVDVIVARASAVLGPDNVVVEYVINPQAPVPDSAPLYVEDTILFETGSSVINGAFVPLLQLGTALMQQNEAVRITVIAHTDSTGSEEFNLALSQARADTVKEFWTENGIDGSRIDAVGLGESAPAAENTTGTGRAGNRRAEFIIQGILG